MGQLIGMVLVVIAITIAKCLECKANERMFNELYSNTMDFSNIRNRSLFSDSFKLVGLFENIESIKKKDLVIGNVFNIGTSDNHKTYAWNGDNFVEIQS